MARRPPAVARVLERVIETVRRHDLIPASGGNVLVAVSGGADSLCLLHTFHALRRLLKIRPAVVHVDHGARPDSALDGRYVRRVAERLGVPCLLERVEGRAPRGASPEAWWRERRYAGFQRARAAAGADLIATAHTRDDQAETVLLSLVRGGGLDGLAGIPWRRDQVIRPLLDVTRDETAAFCRALGLRPRHDPANRDRRYLRVALRLDAIPALERATGREVKATLARAAETLRADAAFMDSLADDAASRVMRGVRGEVRLDAARLNALPSPLAARVAGRALRESGVEPSRAHVEALLDLAAGRPGRRADLPGLLLAARDATYVRVARPSPGPAAMREED